MEVPLLSPSEMAESDLWIVEKILAHKRNVGTGLKWQVQWEGYAEPTWEKTSNLVYKHPQSGEMIVNEELEKYVNDKSDPELSAEIKRISHVLEVGESKRH